MSGPAKRDLGAYQGSTFQVTLTWKDSTGTPIDLTGCAAAMSVKNGSAVLASLTSGTGGGLVLGGTAGTIAIQIAASVILTMPPSNSAYDLLVQMSDGTIRAILSGAFTVREGITLNVG